MKLRVIKAKSRRKAGEYLQKKLNRGESDEFTLLDEEANLLHDLHSGNLRREQNEAVMAPTLLSSELCATLLSAQLIYCVCAFQFPTLLSSELCGNAVVQ